MTDRFRSTVNLEIHALTPLDLSTGSPDLGTPKLGIRMNFSVPHLGAAASFSRRVGEIEQANEGKPLGSFYDEIFWCASGCVLCGVAGLEAYANELFFDRSTAFPDYSRDQLDRLWERFERKPTLEKFNLALQLRGKAKFDRGSQPYQDAAALIELRNALTHFQPEWEDEQVRHRRLSGRLKGRFDLSAFFRRTEEGAFPRRWATHDCTVWVVRTCVQLIEEFEARAALQSKLQSYKPFFSP